MKAMLSHEPGGPETLKLTEMEAPEPSKKQVRIRIHAAGLNFPDTLIIKDMYQMKPPRPFASQPLKWATACWACRALAALPRISLWTPNAL